MKLSLSLKILSVFFWWYLVVFILSTLDMTGFHLPLWAIPDFRGDQYVWDFELFFTAIFVVWAVYLWRSSYNLISNKTFISFTIWATIAHILAMFVVGIARPADFNHLMLDGLALIIPLILVMMGYRRELKIC